MKIAMITNAPVTDCYGFNLICSQFEDQDDVHIDRYYLVQDPQLPYGREVIEQLQELCRDSDLVGLSMLSSFYQNAAQVSQGLKEKLDVPILMGGKHPTIDPDSCLAHADMICLGDGEDPVIDLVDRFRTGQSWDDIPNLWVKKGDEIIRNPRREPEPDLDRYAFPTYQVEDKYVLDRDTGLIRPAVIKDMDPLINDYPSMISRGCPYVCTFCTVSVDKTLRKMRSRSVENVIGELKYHLNHFPDTRRVFFRDDNLTAMPIEFIEDLSQRWKSEIGLPCSLSGVTAGSPQFREKIELLHDAGFRFFKMGIQSGSERVRRKVFARFDESTDVILDAVKTLDEVVEDKIAYYMITDNPWETEEELVESIRFTSRLPRPFSLGLYSLALYPGTALYRRAKREGLIVDEEELLKTSIMDFKNTYLNKVFLLLKYLEIPPYIIDFMTIKGIYKNPVYQWIFNRLFLIYLGSDSPRRFLSPPKMPNAGAVFELWFKGRSWRYLSRTLAYLHRRRSWI